MENYQPAGPSWSLAGQAMAVPRLPGAPKRTWTGGGGEGRMEMGRARMNLLPPQFSGLNFVGSLDLVVVV